MSVPILSPNLMILASAGSGKTFQLANRVIGLIGAYGHEPERIVALTFTRKAAGEFADSVLSRLAEAAADPAKAEKLWAQIGHEFEVAPVLARVVKALPRFQLGTMDGFFARVVRGFQYELGLSGGTFELIEGPRLETAMSDILSGVLSDALDGGRADEFFHAFRRATLGKEGQGVLSAVEKFLKSWHGWWKSGLTLSGWGGDGVFGALPSPDAWEKHKAGMISALRSTSPPDPVLKVLEQFELHTVGSGRLAKSSGALLERLLEAVPASGEIEVVFNRKSIRFPESVSKQWREMILLLAQCELAAAVGRTKAVAELVERLDAECERRLRGKGLLGFDDVKILMGRWTQDEESRLRREAVDFRLDARYDHWLLDEFQDTSAAEWTGIVPLLDEATSRESGTVFVVGDRKQAIYGWRGGDVSLFDQVEGRTGINGPVSVHTMPVSWRSCPAVLDLVNRVFGDKDTIRSLFGEPMVTRWVWDEHVSAMPEVRGEARVEVVTKDDRDERLIELLRELGIGSRALTCGVLVRTNTQVQTIAALLREHGFDVIEEGRRHPTEDNQVGVVLFQLVRWLADPADDFAREVILMSPLAARLEDRFASKPEERWEGALAHAQSHGFASLAAELLEPLWETLSEFARRRAGDVIAALAEFDATGAATTREASRWLEGLEIAQSPGVAAVQVMTVHKSKGLGFDVVVLPEIEDTQIPNYGHFDVARGWHEGEPWLLEPPAEWVRLLVPALASAQETWADDQRYETMCVLYVALTRAKRGLYVLLPEVPKSRKDAEGWRSLSNWVARSASAGAEGETLFQSGDPAWFTSVSDREAKVHLSTPTLGAAIPRRTRLVPSGKKERTSVSFSGMRAGSAFHAAFERIGWIDEERPVFQDDEIGRMIRRLLDNPEVRPWFERQGRRIELFREQPLDVILDDAWLSGVVDRLHFHRDDEGHLLSIEVIDFKTDQVAGPQELAKRHTAQMVAYRRALQSAYGAMEVRCLILSTHLGIVLDVKSC